MANFKTSLHFKITSGKTSVCHQCLNTFSKKLLQDCSRNSQLKITSIMCTEGYTDGHTDERIHGRTDIPH